RPIAPSPPTAEAQTFVTNGPARRTTARVPPPTSRAPRWIGGRAADASAGLLRGSGARGRAAALEVPLVREAQDRVLRLDRVRQRLERRGEPQDRQRRLLARAFARRAPDDDIHEPAAGTDRDLEHRLPDIVVEIEGRGEIQCADALDALPPRREILGDDRFAGRRRGRAVRVGTFRQRRALV